MIYEINSSNEFKKIIQNFPRWSDIRKRHNKSIGGAFIHAYAKEADDIEQAILDYKKLFFLINYIGKEDSIPDYLNACFIGGNLKISQLSFGFDRKITVTDNVKSFYANIDNSILYQDGNLIFNNKVQDAITTLTDSKHYLTYTIDKEFTYSVASTKYHIWNIFDEFALFAGIKRYANEVNAELARRTLAVFKHFPNSSENGLKNAIKNSVIGYGVDIPDEAIQINTMEEFFTPNIANPRTRNQLFDEIMAFNADILQEKKWDQSLYENPAHPIAYLDHEWDQKLPAYQDGYGYNDSLKIDYFNHLGMGDTTSITVDCYNKDKKTILNYIKNNNVAINIPLTLVKYSNTLKPKNIEYKIKAANALKLNTKAILFNSYKYQQGEAKYVLQDIVNGKDSNITTESNGALEQGKHYKLLFKPTDIYADFTINRCNITGDGKTTSLLKPYGRFILDHDAIKDSRVYTHIAKLNQLLSYDNLSETLKGLTIINAAKPAYLTFDITGMSNQLINMRFLCDEVNITDNTELVSYENFKLFGDNVLASQPTNPAEPNNKKQITIDMGCNSYSFKLLANKDSFSQGTIKVTTTVQGLEPEIRYYSSEYTVKQSFRKYTHVKITIEPIGDNQVKIQDIQAARYDWDIELEHGELIHNDMFTLLPEYNDHNTMTIKLRAYSQFSPTLEFVHIGQSLYASIYAIDIDTNKYKTAPVLDIKTDTIVTLIEIDNGQQKVIDKNFTTYLSYCNPSADVGRIYLSLDNFSTINYASYKIYDLHSRPYIILQPGQKVSTIVINAVLCKPLGSISLYNYLKLDDSKTVYISSLSNNLLIADENNQCIQHKQVTNDVLTYGANYLKIEVNSNPIQTIFCADTIQTIQQSMKKQDFNSIIFRPSIVKEYVAYNKVSMISQSCTVQIANTFSPLVDLTSSLFFKIYPPQDFNGNISFVGATAEYNDESIGLKTIQIDMPIDFNNKSTYTIVINSVSNNYIASSSIPLADRYLINGDYHDLSEFIIIPPNNMVVNTKPVNYEEQVIAESDGFNKLHYSNIAEVNIFNANGNVLDPTAYQILHAEGIIVWKTPAAFGQSFRVQYTINAPLSLSYKDITSLYEAIPYSVDSMFLSETKTFDNLKDNSIISIGAKKIPDAVAIKCSNDCFQAIAINGHKQIAVKKISEPNKLAYHAGYVYDDGLEYYKMLDRFENNIEHIKNVDMDNVTKINGKVYFSMSSANHLLHSDMLPDSQMPLCVFDFNNVSFKYLNDYNRFSSCDSLAMYRILGGNLSLGTGLNGTGIHFTINNSFGYALLDITKYIADDKVKMISMWYQPEENFSVWIAEEAANENSMIFNEGLYISNVRTDFYKIHNYLCTDKPQIKPDRRYYLMIQGSGAIDDIIFSQKYPEKVTKQYLDSLHIKTIDAMGLSNIEDSYDIGDVIALNFDPTGCQFTNTDISNVTWKLSISTAISWGLTQLAQYDIHTLKTIMCSSHKNYLKAETDDAKINIPTTYLPQHNNIRNLYLKINNTQLPEYQGFKTEVHGAELLNGKTHLIDVQEGNIVKIAHNRISNYFSANIFTRKDTIIESIELYGQYAQTSNDADYQYLNIMQKNTGSVITKIYDLGKPFNLMLKNVDYEAENADSNDIKIFARGCSENLNDYQFTAWKEYPTSLVTDTNLHAVTFEHCRYIQFKIVIYNKSISVLLKQFNIEVIK